MENQVNISYNLYGENLIYDVTLNRFFSDVSNVDTLRYLKGRFTNKERFKSRFIDELINVKSKMLEDLNNGSLSFYDHPNPNDFECADNLNELLSLYDKVEPFTYEEAFRIENQEFRTIVFGGIDIGEMINELGSIKINVDGCNVKHKKFDKDGSFLGFEEYHNVYETYEVFGDKLNLTENVYAVKCWCTTTNKEHWIWIDEQYKDKPLEAIASTFMVDEALIPHIKEIKRQGDILIVELNEDVPSEKLTGNEVSLTADQYFSLLTSQT